MDKLNYKFIVDCLFDILYIFTIDLTINIQNYSIFD